MTDECNAPPCESADRATQRADVGPATDRGTLGFVAQNLHAAWQKARRRETGDAAPADPPGPIDGSAPRAAGLGPTSEDLELALAACTEPLVATDLIPTDIWWAQRWIDKATPGEVAAMRALLS